MAYRPLKNYYYEGKGSYETEYNKRVCDYSTISLDFKISSHTAFLVQTPELYEKVINIYRHNGNIKELCCKLPFVAIKQFANRCLIDEIIQTNNIEGVHSSRKEIGSVLNEIKNGDKKRRFYGLVSRYNMLSSEEDIPIRNSTDIRSIYDELVAPEIKIDNPSNLPDGIIFRKDQVDVTSGTGKVIHNGDYPEKNIISNMDNAISILNDNSINPMFSIAIFHYLFGYIHPFYDGNGRVSRFISSYMLSKKLHYLSGYRLSYTIKENISSYYKAFDLCNNDINRGDLTPFVHTFIEIIEESMMQLENALLKRYKSLQIYEKKIDGALNLDEKYSELCFLLLQAALFSSDGISTADLTVNLRITAVTLSKHLSFFREKNMLKEKKVGRSKFYMLDIDELNKKADQGI